MPQKHSPVYENLEFYGQFDTNQKRAQPQSPASRQNVMLNDYLLMQPIGGGRFAHTPVPEPTAGKHNHNHNHNQNHTLPNPIEELASASAPIYENIIPHSGQRAQPQASPATATIYQHTEMATPTPTPMPMATVSTAVNQTELGAMLLASPMHQRSNSSNSSAAAPAGAGGGSLGSPTQRYRNLSLPSHMSPMVSPVPTPLAKLQQHTPIKQQQQQQPQPAHAGINVSVNPNYIEDINSSDYVCMTANLHRGNNSSNVAPPSRSPNNVRLSAASPQPMPQQQQPLPPPPPATSQATSTLSIQMTAAQTQPLQLRATPIATTAPLAVATSPTPSQSSTGKTQTLTQSWPKSLIYKSNQTLSLSFPLLAMLAQPPCGPNEVGVHVHVQHLSHHYIHYHCISSINTVSLPAPCRSHQELAALQRNTATSGWSHRGTA